MVIVFVFREKCDNNMSAYSFPTETENSFDLKF